jgi:hypothetical protein
MEQWYEYLLSHHPWAVHKKKNIPLFGLSWTKVMAFWQPTASHWESQPVVKDPSANAHLYTRTSSDFWLCFSQQRLNLGYTVGAICVLRNSSGTVDLYKVKAMPFTVVAWSKAWTVFARSNTGIVGSNPTQSMAICVRLFYICALLCVGSGLATGWSPVQGVLPTVYRITKLKKQPAPNRGL